MTAALFITGLIISIFLFVNLLNEKNLIESVTVGAAAYFAGHLVISYFLFLIDIYSITRTVTGALLIPVILLGILVYKKKIDFKKRPKFNIKEVIAPILIVLILVPFISVKNNYYGMGQDQGVYQSQVLAFLKGDNKKVKDFAEFYSVAEPDRETFHSRLFALRGTDSVKNHSLEEKYPEGFIDSHTYIHGIPGFTAFMATWADAFGMKNMQGVQTVFYIILLLLTFFTSKNLGLKTSSSVMAEFAVGFSPLVIWLGKSALTEMFLAVIMISFLYLLSEKKDIYNKLSIIPVFLFAIYHVSFYTVLPAFIGVYGMLYFVSHKKYFAIELLSMPFMLVFSFFTMETIQPVYTINNYSIFLQDYIEKSAKPFMEKAILLAFVVLLVVLIAVVFIFRKLKATTFEKLSKSGVFKALLRILIVIPLVLILVHIYKDRDLELTTIKSYLYQIKINTFFVYALSSAFLLMAIALIRSFIKPGLLVKDSACVTLAILFFYLVLIYSAVMRKDMENLYYWGRYLVPFISISCIFVMYICDKLNTYFVSISFALCMTLGIRTNVYMLKAVDDTKMDWEIINNISSMITEYDSVVMAEDTQLVMWMPLKYTTDAKVYPQLTDLGYQAESLLSSSNNVYIVSYRPLIYDEDLVTPVYVDTYTYIPDPSPKYRLKTLYPIDFGAEEKTIYIYKVNRDKVDTTSPDTINYSVQDYYYSYNGLGIYEGNMAWSSEPEVTLNCLLEKKSYDMTIDLSFIIPIHAIYLKSIDVDVLVNGEYVNKFSIAPGNCVDEYKIHIDESFIQNGKNTITLDGVVWYASSINPKDTRKVGYPLEGIIFKEAN